ncbi:MAG: phosphoribosylformylglycinamidine synthase subunit PurS [Gemmatimonadaceae bacterium]
MTTFRVGVHIVPRRGILDPQGRTVTDALHTLGFDGVRDTRIGRHVTVDVEAADAGAADITVRDMCQRLLANPVTEDFEIARVVAV